MCAVCIWRVSEGVISLVNLNGVLFGVFGRLWPSKLLFELMVASNILGTDGLDDQQLVG